MHVIELWAILVYGVPRGLGHRIFVLLLIPASLEGSRIEGADHSINVAQMMEKKCGRVEKYLVRRITDSKETKWYIALKY